MRLTLLAAVLLLSLHTCLATAPASVSLPVDSTAKSSVNKPAPDKRKGTLGFISGLLLGPVGLGGIYLFSHSHVQRKAAKKGCVIFAEVVAVAALCWLIVLGAKGANFSGSGGSNRSSGSGSRSSGGSGRSGSSGSSHSPNNNWVNNINLPDISSSSPPTKKKPAPAPQLPADWPPTLFFKY